VELRRVAIVAVRVEERLVPRNGRVLNDVVATGLHVECSLVIEVAWVSDSTLPQSPRDDELFTYGMGGMGRGVGGGF
jgi:hypothetical protein